MWYILNVILTNSFFASPPPAPRALYSEYMFILTTYCFAMGFTVFLRWFSRPGLCAALSLNFPLSKPLLEAICKIHLERALHSAWMYHMSMV